MVLIAGRVADDGGQMDHRARAAHGANHVLDVAAVAPHELQARMIEHFFDGRRAIDQAIQHANAKSALEKRADHDRSNVACASHDQYQLAAGDGCGTLRFFMFK